MKRKLTILCIATTIIIGSSISWFWLNPWRFPYPKFHLAIKGTYFVDVPLFESLAGIPYIEIEVEGKKIAAVVDLGSSDDIELPKNFLAGLNRKSFLKQVFYFGIRGKRYQSDLYEIPKVEVGSMSIYQIRAKEINPEFIKDLNLGKNEQQSSNQNFARIGWGLFRAFNVFLDCENKKIAFCDSLNTLKKQGYTVDSFIETPISLDRNFIEFEVKTHKGKIRCVLDTGCTLNMLNKDLENGSNGHVIFNPKNIDKHKALNPDNSDLLVLDFNNLYEIPVFKIGKKDFGKITFTKVKIPFATDACVGMEFLRSKLVFIDFPNRKAYFYDKNLK